MTTAIPACVICHHALFTDELDRYACYHCEQRIDSNLAAFVGPRGLYAQLSQQVTPGAGNTGPAVSGTRSPGIPARLEVLSLIAKGGVVTILQTWVEDWASQGHAHLDARGSLQRQVDEAVRTLRFNLDWAVRAHPAVDDFADEIWKMRRLAEARIADAPEPFPLAAPCPCGATIGYTLDSIERWCEGCETRYGHAQLVDLTRTARKQAA